MWVLGQIGVNITGPLSVLFEFGHAAHVGVSGFDPVTYITIPQIAVPSDPKKNNHKIVAVQVGTHIRVRNTSIRNPNVLLQTHVTVFTNHEPHVG
jgi:hypothetical protein